jgi:hypothetical protein
MGCFAATGSSTVECRTTRWNSKGFSSPGSSNAVVNGIRSRALRSSANLSSHDLAAWPGSNPYSELSGPANIGFFEEASSAFKITWSLFVRLAIPFGTLDREEVASIDVESDGKVAA